VGIRPLDRDDSEREGSGDHREADERAREPDRRALRARRASGRGLAPGAAGPLFLGAEAELDEGRPDERRRILAGLRAQRLFEPLFDDPAEG
jgi:hypothetical protein